MLFELRNGVAEVSPEWVDVRDLFLAGNVRQAWQLAQDRRDNDHGPKLRTANDFLLNIEIARACAATRIYLALVRKALSNFPQDPFVQLYAARALAARGRHLGAIEFLLQRQSTLGHSHRAYWIGQLACVYGEVGLSNSCKHWLNVLGKLPGRELPLALYGQSGAYEGMHQWDDAIGLAHRTVTSAPHWTRARAYLISCLLARGRVDDAEFQFAQAERLGHEDSTIDVAAAMLNLSLGRFGQARERLQLLLDRWPQADFARWVRRTLCILLVESGECQAARDLAAGQEKTLGLPPIPEKADGAHCFIPLPLVAQNKNQCMPTSVAMAVYPQGLRFQPDQMFAEMNCRDGTTLWHMRRWIEERGLRFMSVKLEREAIVALLDHRIPLLGVLEGPFNSHVEVVCGYNDDLHTLYVRDPAHWAPVAWPWEIALKRYELNGGLPAVISPDQTAAIAAAERWSSKDFLALVDLACAVAQGHLADAEAAYHAVADDSPSNIIREFHGVSVVISPLTFQQRLRSILNNDDANPVARIRAIMTLESHDAQEVIEKLIEDQGTVSWTWGFRRFLRVLALTKQGRWAQALKVVDQLLLTGGGVAYFWDLKGDILAELGDHVGSRKALEAAIELEPFRMSLREKSLQRAAKKLTYDQYLAEFDGLLAVDPDEKRLLWGRADAIHEGPDGKAYERAVLDAIRWYPRNPRGYVELLNWYRYQARADRENALLAKAKQMLPDVFPTVEPNADTSDQPPTVEVPPDPKLPDDKDELLRIVCSPGDPRRPAAVVRALELQQSGQLPWYGVARLVASRLLYRDSPTSEPVPAASLLPVQPPGATHWFVRMVCEQVTPYNLTVSAAIALNEWLERIVPDFRSFPELWFQRVLLFEQSRRLETTLAELRELLDRYPADSSALYRMGVVKYRQQDPKAARDFLQQALKVNPGLLGAIELLRTVDSELGNSDEAWEGTLRLRKKLPYAMTHLTDEVLAVARRSTLAAAEQTLHDVSGDFPERMIDVVRIRLLWQASEMDRVLAISSRVEVKDDDDDFMFEECLKVKLDVALSQSDSPKILELCDTALRRWPDSTRIKELQAEQFAKSEPERSRALLREVLVTGEPSARTAWQYLSLTANALAAAKELIEQTAEPRRERIAELLAQAVDDENLVPWREAYLDWVRTTFPDSDLLGNRLANYYILSRQPEKAVALARGIYDRNVNDPEAALLLGRAFLDLDASQALANLEQAYAHDRSANTLFEIARCHQVLHDPNRAIESHWEVLSLDRSHAASWTNLYLLSADKMRLWSMLETILQTGTQCQAEYFLVAAVKCALDCRKVMPTSWLPHAAVRFRGLAHQAGFWDEKPTLTSALLAWMWMRPADRNNAPWAPRNWFGSLKARFHWPGKAWIPMG